MGGHIVMNFLWRDRYLMALPGPTQLEEQFNVEHMAVQ